jgi:hypothetical protein
VASAAASVIFPRKDSISVLADAPRQVRDQRAGATGR